MQSTNVASGPLNTYSAQSIFLSSPVIDQIVKPCAPHLEQVVDIAGRAARVLFLLHQVPDVARTDVFQLSDLL